jgi:hypothetical protein
MVSPLHGRIVPTRGDDVAADKSRQIGLAAADDPDQSERCSDRSPDAGTHLGRSGAGAVSSSSVFGVVVRRSCGETGTVASAGGCVVVGSNADIDGVLICAEHGEMFMEGDADVRTR